VAARSDFARGESDSFRWSSLQQLEPRVLLSAVFWDGGGDGATWTVVCDGTRLEHVPPKMVRQA
jgi:hypothetical protein